MTPSITLLVVMLIVIMLSAVMQGVSLFIVMLSVVMLNVVMLFVVMLSVMAPFLLILYLQMSRYAKINFQIVGLSLPDALHSNAL
jgi:hypothetical protein